jgi:hypothetical protein
MNDRFKKRKLELFPEEVKITKNIQRNQHCFMSMLSEHVFFCLFSLRLQNDFLNDFVLIVEIQRIFAGFDENRPSRCQTRVHKAISAI